ncbi:MAG: His/Gly/Thr/Pro-type tRNA ligase C-terminal domain-containing protein [bacterium]
MPNNNNSKNVSKSSGNSHSPKKIHEKATNITKISNKPMTKVAKGKKSKIPEIEKPDPIDKVHKIAEFSARHYGFVPFAGLEVQKEDIVRAKGFKMGTKRANKDEVATSLNFENFLEEHIAITRTYINKGMSDLVQPPMICYSGPLHGNHHFDKHKDHIFSLHVLGNSRSIADAMIIETAYVILKDHVDKGELLIEINSLGDKDCFTKFSKEYVTYFKKNIGELSATCRNAFKKDPMSAVSCDHEKCIAIQDAAPKPISYLTEASRDHFREVLEYIESLNLPYIIDHNLIGSGLYAGGTVFQITALTVKGKQDKKEVLAIGERYNSVSKKAWGKKDVPAIGAHILVEADPSRKVPKIVAVEDIKFYFIHLGYDAKLKSLSILEMLRVAKIPVHQALSRDKITSQIAAAEKLAVPYILILGQKEAIENSVTIRHMNSRVQETVMIKDLIDHLQNLLDS